MNIFNRFIIIFTLFLSVQVFASLNPSLKKTINVVSDARGHLTGVNFSFSKTTEVNAILLETLDGDLIGSCKSSVSETEPQEDGEWTKSIVDGVIPQGATTPDSCLTFVDGLNVGNIIALTIDTVNIFGEHFLLCVNNNCSKKPN